MSSYRIVGLPSNSRAVRSEIAKLRGLLTGVHVMLTHIFLSPPYFREPEAAEREKAVWDEIAFAFAEPITPSDSTADYAPTQVLAEAFKSVGCDGLLYKSRLGDGFSIALFDIDAADLINCCVFQLGAWHLRSGKQAIVILSRSTIRISPHNARHYTANFSSFKSGADLSFGCTPLS